MVHHSCSAIDPGRLDSDDRDLSGRFVQQEAGGLLNKGLAKHREGSVGRSGRKPRIFHGNQGFFLDFSWDFSWNFDLIFRISRFSRDLNLGV